AGRVAAVDHPVRARGHAVAAAVADVVLHHDRAELGAEQRARGAHVQAGGVGAVLAHVGFHEPPEVGVLAPARVGAGERGGGHAQGYGFGAPARFLGGPCGDRLLDERDVPPRGAAQPAGVVVGHAGERDPVLGHRVPLLARHLARLAPDAHRRVGEEALARRRVGVAGVAGGVEAFPGVRAAAGAEERAPQARQEPALVGGWVGHGRHTSVPVSGVTPARRRYCSTNSSRAGPRGRRPGCTSQLVALVAGIETLGSSVCGSRSLAASPVLIPLGPQWYGSPTWCSTCPPTRSGFIRGVTSTRASTAVRAVTMVAHPPLTRPRSRASSGLTSQKNSGCSSDRYGSVRLIAPAVWCSVSR